MIQEPLLTISDLTVRCRSEEKTIDLITQLNLHIHPGEAVALVGESGCGKSMTAHAIINLLGPSLHIAHGEVKLQGEALHTKTQKEMQRIRGKKIGMIFQDPMSSLNPTIQVGWQIAETLVFHEQMSWPEAKKRSLELLEQVEIRDPPATFHAYPFQLSGGMQQRIMIACAIACRPALLIADEPTTALDMHIQAEILALLKKMRSCFQMSLLLITHDLAIVRGMCERAAVMQHGQIVECNTVSALFSAPQHPYTSLLIGTLYEPSAAT
jgi:ABC-type dipeptide/oligopeptide/nickel transport system ATPase component